MPSYLESIPHNILCHIAYLAAVSYVFEPPSGVLRLMLTSRRIYHTLAVPSCPHLYADIFRAKFDLVAVKRRFRNADMLTASSLAAELIQRYSMLQHVHRRQMPDHNLAQDLFTAYMMILENDGLNEAQLVAVGFSEYVLNLVRAQPCQGPATNVLAGAINSLAVWTLWMTLSRLTVTSQDAKVRDEILALLRPSAVAASMRSGVPRLSPQGTIDERNSRIEELGEMGANSLIVSGLPADQKFVHYARQLVSAWPTLSVASIIVTFTLKEAQPLRIPPHLPQTRAIANATMRMGPTMEDYSSMARYRTLLIRDQSASQDNHLEDRPPSPSLAHEQDFARIVQALDPCGIVFRSDIPSYVPGSLSGLWEGTWMASPVTTSSSSSTPSDFLCRQPMQCYLREHLCFSPHVPLRGADFHETDESSAELWDLDPCRLIETQYGFDLKDTASLSTRQYCYERISEDGKLHSGRDPREALDIVITGQTLQHHSVAWGAFRFAGRVRQKDGLIILKREPSDGDSSLGTWFFEGYLHSSGAFVGKWYSNKAVNQHSIVGIFSLGRRVDKRE